MESYDNNLQRGDRPFSTHNKHQYVNDQDLDDSLQHEIPDYISLHGSEGDTGEYVEPDSIETNGNYARANVDTRRIGEPSYTPDSSVNTNGTSKSYITARIRSNDDHSHKKSGYRKFIIAIVVLVVLLVAAAASFGALYFKLKDNHLEIPLPVTSAETTQKSSTPEVTASTTSTSTSPRTTAPTTEENCLTFGGLIADSWCNAYYDCSKKERMVCSFPKLFSTDTKTCEHFDSVACGQRIETKHECDYDSTGESCIREFDNCVGKPDGLNEHDAKLWTQYYVICYKERFVGEYICPIVDDMQQFFSPVYKACVSKFRIPPKYGGFMPNCTGKDDGTYPNEFNMCRYYTVCAWGQFVRSVLCPDWQKYDELLKECTHSPTNMCVCNKVTGC